MANQTPYCSTNNSSNSFDERELKFELVEFAQNPEPRCPCILLLDTSSSMWGEPINQLNQGLKEFKKQLVQDELAAKRVEVSVVSFNSEVEVLNNFETANSFNAPTLNTRGCTEMGRAIEVAINMLEKRKADYKSNGISYYRPWIFLITDGAPTDDVTRAISKELEKDKSNIVISALCPGPVATNFNNVAGVKFSLKPLSSQYVAKYGIDNLLNKKKIIIPGFMNKCLHFFSKIVPSSISMESVYRNQTRKR